jgi:cardiolipin synthase
MTAGVDDPSAGPIPTAPPWFSVGANEVRLLRDGVEAFPAMLGAIAAAQREVLVEFYWISPDAVGVLFRDALVERAEAGVTVRVIYDSLGSAALTAAWWRPLIDAGGSVWEYHALNALTPTFRFGNLVQRDHRKLLIVDGAIGFTGGINLGLPWQAADHGGGGWRDNAIAARGEVVEEMRALFYRTWHRVTREPVPSDVRKLAHRRDATVYVLASQRRRRRNIHREYLIRIAGARRTIDIANAYFLPDLRLRRALYRAVARGVRVRILLPAISDVPGIQLAIEALWGRMLRRGVEIHALPPPMLHAKTAIIDERFVTIGSYNLDERSFRKNLEANLAVVDEAFAKHVAESFERDLVRSNRIELDAWEKRSLAQRGAEWLAIAFREFW